MKMFNKSARLAVVIVAMSLVLSACGGGQTKTPTAAATNATFVIAPNLEVVTDLDPGVSYSNEIIAMQNLYETLTRYNPKTKKADPLLAQSWIKSADGKTWTFKLRTGVTFHDGRVMDATSVKEAIERTRKTAAGASYIWDAVTSITAQDAQTVVFNLKYPVALDLVASSGYSAYIYDTKAYGTSDGHSWFNTGKDAGTGPYTISNWTKGAETEMKLASYDKYWGGWSGSHFKNIEFRVTPTATTAWQLLQSGGVDYVQWLNPQLFAQAKKTASVQTSESPSFQNLVALYNTATGPMSDVRVRKAVQLAIDYSGLVTSLKGSVVAASGAVPQGLLGYTSGLEGKTDLAAAGILLKQAGYGTGGKALTLDMTYAQGDDAQAKFATLLASAIQQLGGTLKATPMEWNAQWDRAKSPTSSKRQDIFVMYWYSDYPDAYSWFSNLFHGSSAISFNLSYINDAQMNTAIDALPELSAVDPAKAQASYESIQKRALRDLAIGSFLYVENYQRVLSKRVGGFVDNPAYPNVVHVYDVTPQG